MDEANAGAADAEDVILEAAAPLAIRFPAVSWNNGSWNQVVLSEPEAGQLIQARLKADPYDQVAELVRLVAKIPPQVALKLPQRVIERASDYFAGFSTPSQRKPAGG